MQKKPDKKAESKSKSKSYGRNTGTNYGAHRKGANLGWCVTRNGFSLAHVVQSNQIPFCRHERGAVLTNCLNCGKVYISMLSLLGGDPFVLLSIVYFVSSLTLFVFFVLFFCHENARWLIASQIIFESDGLGPCSFCGERLDIDAARTGAVVVMAVDGGDDRMVVMTVVMRLRRF